VALAARFPPQVQGVEFALAAAYPAPEQVDEDVYP
jgi:hypothetical protein